MAEVGPRGADIQMGKYTPIATAVANITSCAPNGDWHYTRVGKHVHVWGVMFVTPIANATLSLVGISLPIASNPATIVDIIGLANMANYNQASGIDADIALDRAQIRFVSVFSGEQRAFYCSFDYEILT